MHFLSSFPTCLLIPQETRCGAFLCLSGGWNPLCLVHVLRSTGKSWVGEFGVGSCATVCYFEENKYFAHVTKYCWGIQVKFWVTSFADHNVLKNYEYTFDLAFFFFFQFLNLLLSWSCWFLGKNNTRQLLWSAGWGSERSCCWFSSLGRSNYRDKLGKEENGVN